MQDNDNAIVWEDPPESRAAVGHATSPDVRAALMARPGEWARVRDYPGNSVAAAHSCATMIRRGRTPAYAPAGAFEAAARKVDGVYVVYARYVGALLNGDAR